MTPQDRRRRRVFIIGTCVTRDAFEFAADRYEVAKFVSRTTFASAFSGVRFPSDVAMLDPDHRTGSAWERRMVDLDLSKGLSGLLRDNAPAIDVVVVDFADERLDVAQLERAQTGQALAEGALATLSDTAEPLRQWADIRVIESGSDEHYDRWGKAFGRFLGIVRDADLPLVINPIRCAARTVDGRPFDPNYVARHNERLERHRQLAVAAGCATVDYGAMTFVSDPSHKWGESAFHYTDDAYRKFVEEFERVLAT